MELKYTLTPAEEKAAEGLEEWRIQQTFQVWLSSKQEEPLYSLLQKEPRGNVKLLGLEFKPMTQPDWWAYSGAESHSRICYVEDPSGNGGSVYFLSQNMKKIHREITTYIPDEETGEPRDVISYEIWELTSSGSNC